MARASEADRQPAGPAGNPCVAALAAWSRRWPEPSVFASADRQTPLWAVAYSGGADSTALLLAAQAVWPDRVVALHVHHGLQAAADDFLLHAQTVCEARKVPLRVRHVQAGHEPGQSPEDAARQARYRALAEMAQESGAVGVLLGQHAQDQMETLLLALTRGAGLPGLSAMPDRFERHGVVFGRPLLEVDGRALRGWLDAHGVAYVHDPTNLDQRYTRNRIRARLLPALLDAFPASLQTLARSARHAAQAQILLDEVAAEDLQTVGSPPVIGALRRFSRERQANVLRHWLRSGWGVAPSDAQMTECLDQIAACTTRGHGMRLKMATGYLEREGPVLSYRPLVSQ